MRRSTTDWARATASWFVKSNNNRDINEIYEKVDAFLIDELEIDEAKIEDGARLKDDLGIDSLEVVDVIVLVEQEFGFKMRPEQFKDLKTYGEFCRFIESQVG